MSSESNSSRDPTHVAWLKKSRPNAIRAVTEMWQTHHRAAILWTALRKRDSKGCVTDGVEKTASLLRQFDDERAKIQRSLVDGDHDSATKMLAASEFTDAIRIAFSMDDATNAFAELLLTGDNAWLSGDAGEHVLWVCSWRE